MTWIKLVIHPEHDKVLRAADLTESHADAVFAAAVRWFRWVDAHVEGTENSISLAGFRAVTRWPDDRLANAFLSAGIDWLSKDREGRLIPTRTESHFSSSAKKRAIHQAQTAHRRAQHGAHNGAHSVRGESAPEERRKDKSETDTRGRDDDGREAATSALEAWATSDPERSHRAISAARGESSRLYRALSSWEQEPPYPPGVPWHEAVVRCVKAARADGAKFGSDIGYAIKVVNGRLSAWRAGTQPEAPPSGPRGGSAPADDGAAERGLAAAMERSEKRRKAREAGQ